MWRQMHTGNLGGSYRTTGSSAAVLGGAVAGGGSGGSWSSLGSVSSVAAVDGLFSGAGASCLRRFKKPHVVVCERRLSMDMNFGAGVAGLTMRAGDGLWSLEDGL